MKIGKELKTVMREIIRPSKAAEEESGGGEYFIDLHISGPESLVSPFAGTLDGGIGGECAAYLYENASSVPVGRKLNVKIISEKESAERQRDEVAAAVKTRFRRDAADAKKKAKNCALIALILLAVGLALTAASLLLTKLGGLDFFNEVLLVVAGFFIWEASDYYFLRRTSHRIRMVTNARLFAASVLFETAGAETVSTPPACG